MDSAVCRGRASARQVCPSGTDFSLCSRRSRNRPTHAPTITFRDAQRVRRRPCSGAACCANAPARLLPNLHLNKPLLNPIPIAKPKSRQSLTLTKKPNHLPNRINPSPPPHRHAHTVSKRKRHRIRRQTRQRHHQRSRSRRIRHVRKISQKEIHRRRAKRPPQSRSRGRSQPLFRNPPPRQIVGLQTRPRLPPQPLHRPRSLQIRQRAHVKAGTPRGIIPVRNNLGHLHHA
jgi:hypothetical protein